MAMTAADSGAVASSGAGTAGAGHSGIDAKPIDVVWLVRNMFRQMPHQHMPGSGVLPTEWLDGPAIANALRAIGRQNPSLLLSYGIPQGFLPLRQQLQHKLAEVEIAATPEQIVENVGALDNLEFSQQELTEIDRFAVEGGINLWEKPSSAE